MKILIVFLSFSALASAQFSGIGVFGNLAKNIVKDVPIVSYAQDFINFMLKNGKTYSSAAERAFREGVFTDRKKLIDARNAAFAAGKSGYKATVNAFSDMTKSELLKRLTGSRRSAAGDEMASRHRQTYQPVSTQTTPESFDWRQKGGVTPIKNGGDCGACWTFAVTGAIEGHIFRKTGRLPNLSEQNLIDCGTKEFGLDGCDGGFYDYGFAFVKQQNGIAATANYPYTEEEEDCAYTDDMKAAVINGFAIIPANDVNSIKQVIATLGPVACAMKFDESQSLSSYDGGIYDDEDCNDGDFIHSVILVGYGSTRGRDYWIAKNDWGRNWGENGYFRLPRGKNACGIEQYCSIPLV